MDNPYRTPQSDVAAAEQRKATQDLPSVVPGPKGIGGWLILVIIGLIASPVRIIYLLVTTYVPFFTEGTWAFLTTPGTEQYHPLWAPLLIFEIAGNLVIVALAIITLIFLFRQLRLTPKLAIAYYSFALLFVVTDYFVAELIPAVAANPDPENLRELVRTVVAAAIWVPYFRVSKRVKNTFVK